MPPKRSASGTTAPASQAKKSKTAVSASRNVDAGFRLAVQDADKANSYICICRPPFIRDGYDPDDDEDDEDDEGDEDEEEEEEEDGANKEDKTKQKKAKCDGGKTCFCNKPASEHPEHEWILTLAGHRKFMSQFDMYDVRDPDNFDMYTFNDHLAYGTLEVICNLVLDYEEASNWQEQWWACEALVLFLFARGSDYAMIDDGDLARSTAQMLGRLFLAMLSRLENTDLLSEGSQVKNLGLVMTLCIKQASDARGMDLLQDEDEDKLKKPSFEWVPDRCDDYIHAYANKYGIRLHGVDSVEELTADLKDVSLPAKGDHLWDWPAKFKSFKKAATLPNHFGRGAAFGGDGHDITSWPSATRAKHSFSKKDPLGKKERDAIKDGLIMSIA